MCLKKVSSIIILIVAYQLSVAGFSPGLCIAHQPCHDNDLDHAQANSNTHYQSTPHLPLASSVSDHVHEIDCVNPFDHCACRCQKSDQNASGNVYLLTGSHHNTLVRIYGPYSVRQVIHQLHSEPLFFQLNSIPQFTHRSIDSLLSVCLLI